MSTIFFALLLVIGTSADKYFFASPEDMLNSKEPHCVEEDLNTKSLQIPEPHRLDGFKLKGTYVCERNIFNYGERNSFVDYIASHQVNRARSAAMALQKIIEGDSGGANTILKEGKQPLSFEFETDMTDVLPTLKSTFIQEFTAVFGPETVSRLSNNISNNKNYYPRIKIKIKKLQDPMAFMEISYFSKNNSELIEVRKL